MSWTPSPRAPWVDHLIALGRNLGDDGRGLISLDETSVIREAKRITGLEDLGSTTFREPLAILLRALEDEARLHTVGRLIARAEIQRILQNRLRVEDVIRQNPEITSQPITQPIVVTGLGRSGTTFLHELLAQDPSNRVPMLWETMFSVPPPEGASYGSDPRIAQAQHEADLMEAIVPAFATMQEVAGDLPTECIFLFAHELATDMFLGEYNVPSYTRWIIGAPPGPAYAYHRRLLQLLQWRHRRDRWILKAPSHLHNLPALFAEYPDARVVITHRDPLKVVGSLTNLMANLQWMRTDHVNYDGLVKQMSFGFAFQLEKVMQERERGEVPRDQILDVGYHELVTAPLATVRRIYTHFGIALSAAAVARIEACLAARPRERRGTHEYSFADTGLDLTKERPRLKRYQDLHRVASEV